VHGNASLSKSTLKTSKNSVELNSTAGLSSIRCDEFLKILMDFLPLRIHLNAGLKERERANYNMRVYSRMEKY
jgi:hypothetical protein